MAATFSSSKNNTGYDSTASQATGALSTGINCLSQSVGAPAGMPPRSGGALFGLSVNVPAVPVEAKAEVPAEVPAV